MCVTCPLKYVFPPNFYNIYYLLTYFHYPQVNRVVLTYLHHPFTIENEGACSCTISITLPSLKTSSPLRTRANALVFDDGCSFTVENEHVFARFQRWLFVCHLSPLKTRTIRVTEKIPGDYLDHTLLTIQLILGNVRQKWTCSTFTLTHKSASQV